MVFFYNGIENWDYNNALRYFLRLKDFTDWRRSPGSQGYYSFAEGLFRSFLYSSFFYTVQLKNFISTQHKNLIVMNCDELS